MAGKTGAVVVANKDSQEPTKVVIDMPQPFWVVSSQSAPVGDPKSGKITRRNAVGLWLSGFVGGVILMALADVTDLHMCVGECGGNQFTLWDVWGTK